MLLEYKLHTDQDLLGRTYAHIRGILDCEATMATALAKIAAHRRITENGARCLCDAVRRAFRMRPPPDEMIAACVRSMGAKTTVDEIATRIKTSKTYAKWLARNPEPKPVKPVRRHAGPIFRRARGKGDTKSHGGTVFTIEPYFPETKPPKQGKAAGAGAPIWKRVSTKARVEADDVTRKKKREDW